MKTLRRFFGWFFLVLGGFSIFQNLILALVLISWALLLLPAANKFAVKKGLRLDPWKRFAIVVTGILLVNLTTSRLQPSQSATQSTSPNPSVVAEPAPIQASSSPSEATAATAEVQSTVPQVSPGDAQPVTPPSPNPEREAHIKKTGLDFSYDFVGTAVIDKEVVTVTYTQELPSKTQIWLVELDLTNKTWRDWVTENGQKYDWANGKFTIETNEDTVTLYADVLDTDGSVIVANSYVVTYPSK